MTVPFLAVIVTAVAIIAEHRRRRRAVETGDSLSYIFAVAACASIVAFFVVLFFYREPPAPANAPAKPRRSIGRILLDMVLVLRNGRFTLFLVVMSGFFFVYNQVYNVLPLYAKRVIEPSPAMDLYTAANPFVIVCLQLAITQYFGKMKAIRSIVVGTVIIGVSMLINVYPIYAAGGMRAITANWLPLGSVFLILTVALIAFGELFTSARMYEYIGSLAPKGQEGLFLGYANLPLALGSLAGGPGRRVHLQRHHGERRDHAARRAARTGAGAGRARLDRADGRSASCRRSRCGCSTGGSSGSRRSADAVAGEDVMTRTRRTAAVLMAAMGIAAAASAQEVKVAKPASLGVQANIVFLYYKDVPAAQRFYEDVIGLTLAVDQGFSKIYQVSPTSFIGLVDEAQGLHRASEAKAVTVSFVTEQIDQWYEYLQSKGVKMRGPMGNATRHPTRGFVAYDPEGYYLEFERFLDHPQNTRLLDALKKR